MAPTSPLKESCQLWNLILKKYKKSILQKLTLLSLQNENCLCDPPTSTTSLAKNTSTEDAQHLIFLNIQEIQLRNCYVTMNCFYYLMSWFPNMKRLFLSDMSLEGFQSFCMHESPFASGMISESQSSSFMQSSRNIINFTLRFRQFEGIEFSKVTQQDFAFIEATKFPFLKDLTIKGCNIKELPFLSSVETLCLDQSILEISLTKLTSLYPNLRSLSLTSASLLGYDPSARNRDQDNGQFPYVEYLSLTNTEFTYNDDTDSPLHSDAIDFLLTSVLSRFPNLVSLCLREGSYFITEKTENYLISQLPKLSFFNRSQVTVHC